MKIIKMEINNTRFEFVCNSRSTRHGYKGTKPGKIQRHCNRIGKPTFFKRFRLDSIF